MKRNELLDVYAKKLHIKNYSYRTEKSYIHYLNLFLDYISNNKSQNEEPKLVINFLDYCKTEKKFSYSSMKQALASVRFLYLEVLNKRIDFNFFFKMRKPDSLPNVLSPGQVKNIIDSITNLKHKAIISTIYSCGLGYQKLFG